MGIQSKIMKQTKGEAVKTDNENMDVLMKAIKAVHSVAVNSSSVTEADLTRQRKEQEFFSKLITPSSKINVEKFNVGEVPAEWIKPDFAHGDRAIILYCHGGGYTCGNLNLARILAGKMALSTGLEVLSFAYRLAPENPYPAAIEDALEVWNYLMYMGFGASDIILAGDSAGGNLALELCINLKNNGRMIPRGLILMSPWTDMTMSGQSYKTCKEKDPTITAEYIDAVREAYAGKKAKFERPEYSPLFADLKNMPPAIIQVGSNEVLRSDSEMLAKKLRESGSFVRIEVYKGGWHVFQQMPLGISARAMDEIRGFTDSIIR